MQIQYFSIYLEKWIVLALFDKKLKQDEFLSFFAISVVKPYPQEVSTGNSDSASQKNIERVKTIQYFFLDQAQSRKFQSYFSALQEHLRASFYRKFYEHLFFRPPGLSQFSELVKTAIERKDDANDFANVNFSWKLVIPRQ